MSNRPNSFVVLREMEKKKKEKETRDSERKIRLQIHFINGDKYTMHFRPDDTIEFITSELRRVHREDATLIFCGRALALDATLEGRGISDGHIIHGLRKVRGD